MFHMLTCCNLKPGVTLETFREALAALTAHMRSRDLLVSTGPIGRRRRDTIMDTDDERDHEYFFVMSFRDRAQCDRAVEHVRRHEEPGDSTHRSAYALVADPIFICWEDV